MFGDGLVNEQALVGEQTLVGFKSVVSNFRGGTGHDSSPFGVRRRSSVLIPPDADPSTGEERKEESR
jgi:hypothetical protein